MLDGAEQVFPTRTYTRGEVYGVLPTVDRYDEGFHFRGWVTNLEDTVGVAVDQLAEMDQGALYCNWEAIYLNLSTGAVEFAAYPEGDGATRTVEVSANDKWICTTDADWLTLATAENDGNDAVSDIHDGVITIGATPNRSELPRSALVTVSRENGKLVREITVTQLAMEHAAMPEIHTANGQTTFSDYVAQVWITCVTPGVSIYYTTDGSEPTQESILYKEPIIIDENKYIRAIAYKPSHENSYIANFNFRLKNRKIKIYLSPLKKKRDYIDYLIIIT
jgi:hypothetical protein